MVVVNQALCGIRHASHLYISKPSAAFPSDILPAKSSESRHSPFPPKIWNLGVMDINVALNAT